ncbi:MAG TPA: nucleoside deaminase [Candidatus Aphodovivens excrementavium]|nr:nucleoside deaminase [Candidatus Aphodovivens excrementavium]
MQVAIGEAYQGIEAGDGGPFGSVIVKDGEIVGQGHNRVLANNDPTCHGEMEAIRDACQNLGTYDLAGCELYTTAEPCPMCLGAVLWSNMDVVYYGCTREDSAEIGFRDDAFYRQLNGEEETVGLQEFDRDTCRQLFDDYAAGNAQRY